MASDGSLLAKVISELISAFVTVIEEKDIAFRGHGERVAAHCVNLARKINLPKREIDTLYLAGKLHDIGKVYIPSEIIHSPAELSESEESFYQQHPVIAERIISRISIFKDLLPIIRHQSEYFDGSGYPDGIKGDAIPIGARVLCLANRYDTLTSASPSRPVMNMNDALNELRKEARSKFDPNLVGVFSEMIQETSSRSGSTDEPGGIVREAIHKIFNKFKTGQVELPIIPSIVQKIRDTLSSSSSSIDVLAKLLEMDPVISVRLITVANSVVYRRGEKVLTVRQAVPRLGTKETESLVMAIINKGMYETNAPEMRDLMQRLWMHSLACAFAARLIAEKLSMNDVEKYFTMGLIHDIGKVPLVQGITTLQSLGEESVKDLDMPTIMTVLQEAHDGLGGTLLKGWDFPDELVRITQQHENPTLSEQTEKALLLIHLANMLTRKIGYSLYPEPDMDLAGIPSAQLLRIGTEDLEAIGKRVMEMVQSTSNAF
jgi:putative nucleotidyltransferase with HDIG domain